MGFSFFVQKTILTSLVYGHKEEPLIIKGSYRMLNSKATENFGLGTLVVSNIDVTKAGRYL